MRKEKKKLENKLTPRGEMLHEAHSRQQGTSLRHGETIVVDDIKITIGTKCSCGHRIRGVNHLEGAHHNKRVPRCGNH